MSWLEHLTSHYQLKSREEAKHDAHALTCWLSAHRGGLLDEHLLESGNELRPYLDYLAGKVIGNSLLGTPWSAYDHAYYRIEPHDNRQPPGVDWLLTLPEAPLYFDNDSIGVGVYVDRVADIMSEAKSRIVLCNPYWSENAVIRLINRLHDWSPAPELSFSLITRTDLSEADRLAIGHLQNMLVPKGIACRSLSPIHSGMGLMHAKFVLADDRKIILGSTNLTHSGVAENIELSVLIESENVVKPVAEFIHACFVESEEKKEEE